MKRLLALFGLVSAHESERQLERANVKLGAITDYLAIVDPMGRYGRDYAYLPHIGVTILGGNFSLENTRMEDARIVVHPFATNVRICRVFMGSGCKLDFAERDSETLPEARTNCPRCGLGNEGKDDPANCSQCGIVWYRVPQRGYGG